MPLMWFVAGVLLTLLSLLVLSPWLRKMSIRTFIAAEAVVLMGAIGLYFSLLRPEPVVVPAAAPAMPAAGAFASAAQAIDAATDKPAAGTAAAPVAAGSMESAVTSLEGRLAKGGGSADDWELLAKSFEFLGRPADAAQARAHQLPTVNAATTNAAAAAVAGRPTISGEITLGAALKSKAMAGEALFIVAKSVDSPGIPVAVIRASVGAWPLKFTLNDSQSMLPGRNLSTAGRVTVEARISRTGQPLPGPGDLQGASGVIDPAGGRPVKIVIDKEIS